jgi:hypothetical protein
VNCRKNEVGKGKSMSKFCYSHREHSDISN